MISKQIKNVWKHFLEDLLFRNSIYLMLTTGAMGGFGFIFWLISTRLFTPDQIGLGTTIISTMSLISLISMFGLGSTIIRFLPSSKTKNEEINTALTLITITSTLFSLIFIIFLPYFSPKILFIRENNFYILGFVLITILSSVNSLTDSIFIAYRSAHFNLITDGFIISITKLIAPIFFVSIGAYGVFFSSGIATIIGTLASLIILVKRFSYKPVFALNKEVFKKVFNYSFINYISSFFSTLPNLLLPIIIINKLGPAESGYFFMCFMIINLLYTVSSSVAQSLFAEGSYGEDLLLKLLKRSLKILFYILIPGSLFLAFVGPYILGFFGEAYKIGGSKVILILALSSPIISMYNLGSTLLKIRNQMYSVITINIFYALSICGLSYLYASRGLQWVALCWVFGNLVAGSISFIMIYKYRHLPTPKNL